jgi:hypothetical protein
MDVGYPTLSTMTIRKDRAAALQLDRNEQEIVLFDEEGVTSFPSGTDEGTDPARSAGNLVRSWADDPDGDLIEVWLEERFCL